MSLLARAARTIMASEPKKVPIPRNGVDYRGKVVLAPMVRSGELPSRLLALQYGADLVWGPETVDKSMIGTTRRLNPDAGTIDWVRKPSLGGKTATMAPADVKDSIIYRVHPEREGRRLIFQLGTADPDLAVQAARLVAGDVAGIDVNAGCPKPFSTHAGMGAALLRTPDRLCAILEALVASITPEFHIGVSVKIRVLDTAAETEALARRLVATGITGLTVHCRTPAMRPREPAVRDCGRLAAVAAVCRGAGVACLLNGDVASRDEGLALAAAHGVDGAMIATCAERNASCFLPGAPPPRPWPEVAEQYLRCALDVDNKFGNSKYLLCQIVPGKSAEYRRLQPCRSYVRVCDALGLDDLADRAREVDAVLGLDSDRGVTAAAQRKAKETNSSALAAGGQMAETRVNRAQVKKGLAERGAGAQEETETEVQPAAPPAEGIAIAV
ncbi:dihydrouridine synthase [Hypoxylon sp. FL1284]|nr:dihydrouridine synthase [Hypoxylon sp. FL1284]